MMEYAATVTVLWIITGVVAMVLASKLREAQNKASQWYDSSLESDALATHYAGQIEELGQYLKKHHPEVDVTGAYHTVCQAAEVVMREQAADLAQIEANLSRFDLAPKKPTPRKKAGVRVKK